MGKASTSKYIFKNVFSQTLYCIIDGLGLAVVFDARVSRKVGRDINKRTSRRDPRRFLLGIIFAPLSCDEFAFSLVSPPGSIATPTIAVTFL